MGQLFKLIGVFIILFVLTSTTMAKNQDRYHAYTEISESDKIAILVQKLEKAVNRGDPNRIINFFDTSYEDNDAEKTALLARLEIVLPELKDKSLNNATSSPGNNQIHFTIAPNFETKNDTIIVQCQVDRKNCYPDHENTLELYIIRNADRLCFTNADSFLDNLEQLSNTTSIPVLKTTDNNVKSLANVNSSKELANLFTHKAFYTSSGKAASIDVFSRTEAQANFDGKSIFSRPYDVLETIMYDSELGDNWGMVSSDANWDRFISFAEHNYSGQPAIFGTTDYMAPQFDTGSYALRYPQGVAMLTDQDLYICNPTYDQVGRYYINLTTPSLDNMPAIGRIDYDGLPIDRPVDIDAAHMPLYLPEVTYCNFYNWLAICDQYNHRIVITSFEGGEEAVIGEYGVGDFRLRNPTSVIFARDWQTGWQTHDIYVADDGNKRVVKFGSTVFREYDSFITSHDSVFGAEAIISSVDVDGFGQVYALDSYNGKIYKFDEDLSLIASWGQIGADVNSLYYPNRMAITRGWENQFVSECEEEVLVPKRMGEILITETYTETTGLKRFLFSNELIDFTTSYIPRNCDYDTLIGNYVTVDWYQADYASIRIVLSISNYGTAVDYSELFIPGDHGRNFGLPPDIPQTGTYTVDIYLISQYTGETLQHETSSGPYDHGSCNYPPTIINGPFITGNDSCFMYDAWPPYQCGVDVIDPDDPAEDLIYTYVTEWCDPEKRIGMFWHPDSADGAFHLYRDSVVTNRNRIILEPDRGALPDPPSCPPIPTIKIPDATRYIPLLLFSVRIEDPNGGWTERRFTEGNLPFGLGTNTCAPDPEPDTPKVGCPILYIEQDGEWSVINNILAESEDAAEYVTEIYPIDEVKLNSAGEYHLRITEETLGEITYLKSVRASTVNYPNSERVVFTTSNMLYSIDTSTVKPSTAFDAAGNDITGLLRNQDGQCFEDYSQGFITLEYNIPKSLETGALNQIGGPDLPPANKNFLKPAISPGDQLVSQNTFYALDENDNWVLVGESFPRYYGEGRPAELSDYIFEGKLSLKIEYGDNISLDYLPYRLYKPIEASPMPLQLLSANHSELGDVTDQISISYNEDLTLEEGQYLDLVLKGDKPPEDHNQLILFSSWGKYEKEHDFNSISSVPEFDQNYPNPFNPTTTFSFSIPATQYVKLELFNILGQKVIVLQDNELPAGRYNVVWDSRNSSGEQVASGVYFARFIAGDYTASRKIEVLK